MSADSSAQEKIVESASQQPTATHIPEDRKTIKRLLFPYKYVSDVENGTREDWRRTMEEFEPHSVFKCCSYPKTGGRLGNCYLLWAIAGPHYRNVIFTLTVPILIFICFLGSMRYYSVWNLWAVYVGIVLLVANEFCLLVTTLSNPGIVFRGTQPIDENSKLKCEDCKISRQSKFIHHCSDCNLCCYELDHHCIWMGKCIGKQTLYWFKASLGIILVSMIFASVIPYFCIYL